jgi:hypothetical protein
MQTEEKSFNDCLNINNYGIDQLEFESDSKIAYINNSESILKIQKDKIKELKDNIQRQVSFYSNNEINIFK